MGFHTRVSLYAEKVYMYVGREKLAVLLLAKKILYIDPTFVTFGELYKSLRESENEKLKRLHRTKICSRYRRRI